jgi:hypothetical protein
MAAFCRRRELGYSTMISWRRAARIDREQDTAPRFVEIEGARPEEKDRWQPFPGGGIQEAHPMAGVLLAELALPGGAVLRIFQSAGTAAASVKGGAS